MNLHKDGQHRIVNHVDQIWAELSIHFPVITEENMTEEDEEFMLDNFVTFFIAGKFVISALKLWEI